MPDDIYDAPGVGGSRPSNDVAVSGASPPTAHPVLPTVMRRYKDAYTEAHAVVAVGEVVKTLAVVAAGLSIVGGVWSAGEAHGQMQVAMACAGFAGAVLLGVPIYVLGILTCAAGQLNLAAIDTAVNSSRVLSDEQVSAVMESRFSL